MQKTERVIILKKLMTLTLVLAMLALSACGDTAETADPQSDADSEETVSGEDSVAPPASNAPAEGGQPGEIEGSVGKIVSVDGETITLLTAQTPEMDGERPDGELPDGDGQTPGGRGGPGGPDGDEPDGELPDGEPPEMDGDLPELDGERPERDGEAPDLDGEAPEGGPGGRRGGGMGGAMIFSFSEESVSYPLSASLSVTGTDGESLDLESLSADDVIRFELDDDGEVVSIRLMDLEGGGRGEGGPPDDLPNEDEDEA